VKTDFHVLKLKFYACNFKQALYPLHKLNIVWPWQHKNTFIQAFRSVLYLVVKLACANAALLFLQIISGQFLSQQKLSTYVEVDMFGLQEDIRRKVFKTKTVDGNSTNPRYNSPVFSFEKASIIVLNQLYFHLHYFTYLDLKFSFKTTFWLLNSILMNL